jgi:hypothetical protein
MTHHTHIVANIARVGFVVLVGTILAIAAGDIAAAKHRKGHLRAHRSIAQNHAQFLPQQPVRLGPMRYYGGPKSPMWRSPIEN